MNLMTEHPAIACVAAYWIFSAFVGGMPQPTQGSSTFYVWLHNSLHILAGNLTAAMQTRYPALPTLPAGVAASQETTTTTTIAK